MAGKTIDRFISALMCAALLLTLSGCAEASGSGAGGELKLDYAGEDSESTESGPSDDGGWLAWLRNALTADRSTGNKKSSESSSGAAASASKPDTVKDIYQKGAADYEEKQKSSSSSGAAEEKDSGSGRAEDKKKDAGSSSSSSSQSESGSESAPSGNTVTITITCHTAVNNGMHLQSKWAGIVPASGVILPVTTVEIEDGETVYSVLARVCDKYKIQMEYTGGTESGCYIQGINNLYEFDGGRWSGWMYCVNGWYPNYGCGVYHLKAGDVIEWNYTCDLGCDLENGDPNGYGKDWKDTHD